MDSYVLSAEKLAPQNVYIHWPDGVVVGYRWQLFTTVRTSHF
jgi:hypothetical protein